MGLTQQIGASSLIKPGVIDNTAARPASPYEGQVIFQKDTDQLLVWNGTAWVIPNAPAQNPDGLELVTTCTASFTSGTAGSVSNGVVTIGTTNTAITVSNAFSATYDNYKIIISGGVASASGLLAFQIDGITGSSYYGGSFSTNYINGAYIGDFMNGSTKWTVCGFHSATVIMMNMELLSPFLAKRKWMNSNPVILSGNGFGISVGECADSSSRTGFVITPQTGTLTGGTIRVYGYRNS